MGRSAYVFGSDMLGVEVIAVVEMPEAVGEAETR